MRKIKYLATAFVENERVTNKREGNRWKALIMEHKETEGVIKSRKSKCDAGQFVRLFQSLENML
jgi:hypothetical protein